MSEFFLQLKRRSKYSTKPNGEFYSYEFFREHCREEIASDCDGRCVYCDSHEMEVGGRESMELDHFRPWSRAEFSHLKNDPNNFHHSCGRCNRLKGSCWPSTHPSNPHDGVAGFIDPFADDRRLYFEVKTDGTLEGKRPPAAYMIKLLQLNRPLLTLLRLRRMLKAELAAYVEKMDIEIKAVLADGGNLKREQLAQEWVRFRELQQLIELCEAPLPSSKKH